MKLYKIFETIIGLLVIAIFIIFSVSIFKRTDVFNQYVNSYNSLNLYFNSAYGITKGNLVKVNGVKVGYVNSILLTQSNRAKVQILINKDVNIPKDSSFVVLSQGFTGGQYINIKLGKDNDFLPHNSDVNNTRDFQSLEDKVGEIINNLIK